MWQIRGNGVVVGCIYEPCQLIMVVLHVFEGKLRLNFGRQTFKKIAMHFGFAARQSAVPKFSGFELKCTLN